MQNFAANVHGDFAGKVAAGHGCCHFRDISHLAGKVRSHGVDRVRQILPGSVHTRYHSLATEFAVGSYFASHARHFSSEHTQLLNHGVHDVRGAEEFAFERAAVDIEPDRLR